MGITQDRAHAALQHVKFVRPGLAGHSMGRQGSGKPSHTSTTLSETRINRILQALHALPRPFRRRLQRTTRQTLSDIALMLVMGVSLPAGAANLLVDAASPGIDGTDGACSLSEAIINANLDSLVHGDCLAGAGKDILQLAAGSTLIFTAPASSYPGQLLPTIDSPMVIQGNASTLRIATGVAADTVIAVSDVGDLELQDAVITGASGSGTGTIQPRVKNAGKLQLQNVAILLNPNTTGLLNLPTGDVQANEFTVDAGPDMGSGGTSYGSGIHNQGTMMLQDSRIQNLYSYNYSVLPGTSAVLLNEGNLDLKRVSIRGNSGFSSGSFNGIDNAGELRGERLHVSNYGSYGIDSGVNNQENGNLVLQDSVISGNGGNKYNGRGGLFNQGTASLLRVQVDHNFGGLSNSGDMEIVDSSVSGNDGYWSGGLFNTGKLVLSGVTVAYNFGFYGGGFFNNTSRYGDVGDAQVRNSTFVGNGAAYYSSGVVNEGTLTMSGSSVMGSYSYDAPAGITNAGSLSLTHTLVTGGDIVSNTGTVSGSEYNFFGDSSQTTAELFSGFTPGVMDITASSDGMLPTALADIIELEATSYGDVIPRLADNGGPTMTVALASGSPAMDAGAALCEDTDQRGIPRPQGGACDIGAVEIQATVAASCSSYTDYEARGCTGIYRIRNLADLAAYKASNYGLGSDGKYRYVRVVNSLGDGSQPLEIHSPCKITVAGPVTLRGSQVTVDGKRGVLMNWGSKIETDGSACLLTEKNSVELKGGHRVGAGALTLQSQRLSRIGPWSQVTVAGPVRLASLGTGTEAKVEIRNDSQVVADSLDLVAAYQAAIGGRVGITTAGDTRVEVGDVADSHAVLRYQSVLQTGGDLHFNSGGVSRLAAETEVSVGGTLEMNAGTAGQCRVAGSASILASDTTGNCASVLP